MGIHADDVIPYLVGGKHDDSEFNPKDLEEGLRVETEHLTDSEDPDQREIAKTIAKAHLLENPKYYRYLAAMEAQMRRDTLGGKRTK